MLLDAKNILNNILNIILNNILNNMHIINYNNI